jgi:hypothetical protein
MVKNEEKRLKMVLKGKKTIKNCQICEFFERNARCGKNPCKLGHINPCIYCAELVSGFQCKDYKEYKPRDKYLYS